MAAPSHPTNPSTSTQSSAFSLVQTPFPIDNCSCPRFAGISFVPRRVADRVRIIVRRICPAKSCVSCLHCQTGRLREPQPLNSWTETPLLIAPSHLQASPESCSQRVAPGPPWLATIKFDLCRTKPGLLQICKLLGGLHLGNIDLSHLTGCCTCCTPQRNAAVGPYRWSHKGKTKCVRVRRPQRLERIKGLVVCAVYLGNSRGDADRLREGSTAVNRVIKRVKASLVVAEPASTSGNTHIQQRQTYGVQVCK